jgi:DNA-binding response OmpR family regulator
VVPEPDASDPDADISRPSLAMLAWLDDQEASVLLVGMGHPMQAALAAAIARHNVELETAPASAVLDAVLAATPKLILLVGEAARDGGAAVLTKLRTLELAASVPVVVLAEDDRFETRMRALSNGAAAVIPRSASVDAIATRAAELARIGSEEQIRAGVASPTTLDEMLGVVGKRVMARVLSLEEVERTDPERLRLVLREGAPLVALFEDFSAKLKEQILEAERFDYQLGQSEGAAELLGDEALALARSTADVTGVRVLLADPDSMRADAVARALRAHGADVVVAGLSPHEEQVQQLRQFDPMVLLVRSEHFSANTGTLVDRMKVDARLRWAALLISDWEGESRSVAADSALENLLGQLAAMAETEKGLRARGESGKAFDTRLEVLGPARTLRALGHCAKRLRMTVHNPRATVQVEFGDGVVVGARADVHESPPSALAGAPALAALLALRAGRVTIEPIEEPTVLNLMTTVGAALDMAEGAPPPIQTSVPPPDFGDPATHEAKGVRSRAASARLLPVYVGLGLTAALAVAAVTVFVASEGGASGELPAETPQAVVPAEAPAEASAGAAALAPAAQEPPAPAPPATSLTQRASAGDPDAIAALEQKAPEERTVEETIALSEGRAVASRRAIAVLRDRVLREPEMLKDRAIVRQWIGHARDPATAAEALAAIASFPGPIAADLVYEVWIGTPERTASTQLAEEIAKTEAVRRKASPALSIALDLRSVETCEAAKELLPRAHAEADRRSVSVLARMNQRRGCGPRKRDDCYPCLREDKTALSDAIRAVLRRPAPAF